MQDSQAMLPIAAVWARVIRRGTRTARAAVLLAACLACGTAVTTAMAQDYPTRPVNIIVPQTPGGTNDIIARIMADSLAKTLGGSFVVINKGGSGGNIGTELAARSQPDGYTLLLTISTHVINPFVYKSVPYDPVKDFEPIALLAVVPTVVVAHPSFPANNIAELIALAKQKPGAIAYASGGNGTMNHLVGERLKTATGIDMLHIPYRGVAPAIVDMVAGVVPVGVASLPSTISYINSGRLKALGISGPTRSAAAPSIPTIAETVPGFSLELWVGLLGVAGTPKPILEKLLAAVQQSLQSEQLRKQFSEQGAEPQKIGPEQFAKKISSDLVLYKDVVKAAGAVAN